jgi:flagellar basal body-associated protein FliL
VFFERTFLSKIFLTQETQKNKLALAKGLRSADVGAFSSKDSFHSRPIRVRPTVLRLLPPRRVPAKQMSDSKLHSRTGILFLLLVVAGVAIAAIWFWSGGRSEASSPEPVAQIKYTLHLETFVLNLADPGQRSYLRVGIDLGLGRGKAKSDEVLPISQVRDAILGVLSQARVDDLLGESGKSKLKANVLSALQERVPQLMVREVYFTEFLIQR